MGTARVVGVILIIGSLVVGYLGINKLMGSQESGEILGLEVSVANENSQIMAYVLIGVAVIMMFAGIYAVAKRPVKD